MKYLIILLIFFQSIHLSYSQSADVLFQPTERFEDEEINILGITLNLKYCRNIQQIAAVGEAWSQVYWGTIGAPGFVTGIVQNDSIILKMCAYLIKVRTLDTESAVYATAAFLNELTDNKWNHHIEFLDKTWNVANSVYDVRGNGGFRKGALTNASNHRRLINYWDSAAKWYQKTNGEENPQGIETTAERKRQIDEISELAYEQAVLTEALSCPSPKIKANYREAYQDKVIPLDKKRQEAKRNVQYFRKQMYKMGAEIAGANIDMEKEFLRDIEGLVEGVYEYKVSDKKYNIERTVPTGSVDETSGVAKTKDETKTYTYQQVRALKNVRIYNNFRQKYVPLWDSWVRNQKFSSGARGLLNDKQGLIEKKFRRISFECSENELRRRSDSELSRLDFRDPTYRTVFNREHAKCIENLKYSKDKIGNTKVENLMDEYIVRLDRELGVFKRSTAEIWTFESKYLGINPIIRTGTDEAKQQLENRQRDPETCRPTYSAAEMMSYDLKLNSVNVKINERIMNESLKRNVLEEEKAKAESSDAEETSENLARRQKYSEERSKTNNYTTPIVRPGGTGI